MVSVPHVDFWLLRGYVTFGGPQIPLLYSRDDKNLTVRWG